MKVFIRLTNINTGSSKKNMDPDFEGGTELLTSCFKLGPPATASEILLGEHVPCDVLLVVSHLTPAVECGFQKATDFACLVSYVPRTHHSLTESRILRQSILVECGMRTLTRDPS